MPKRARIKLPPEDPEKLGKALEQYKRKWVVILGDEVLKAGDDPVELADWARKRGLRYYRVSYVEDWAKFGGKPPIYIL